MRVIGAEDDQEVVIGQVIDIGLASSGDILVFDSEDHDIKVFASDGEYVRSIGRKGQGPGEFEFTPFALSISEEGWFIAPDGRTIHLYDASGDSYQLREEFNVENTTRDACILNGNIYLQGFTAERPGQSVHVYSRDGEHIRSFGPTYQSENSHVRQSLSSGDIACDRATNRIVLAFHYIPLVYGFTPEGVLEWVSRIHPFDGVPVKQTGERSLTHMWGTPGGDVIQTLTDLPGASVAVQREHIGIDLERDQYYTYWISSTDGTGQYIGDSVVGSIHEATRQHLFSGPNAPFPRVEMYSVEDVGWHASTTAE